MSNELPHFEAPPVVETVLGVQFDRLAGFSPVMAGVFRERHLGESWRYDSTVQRLDEDKYEERLPFTPKGLRIVTPPLDDVRVRLVNSNDDRMLQLQSTWFLYNWRFIEQQYPRYDVLRPEFDSYREAFGHFVNTENLGILKPTLWEVTYVNHIPRGGLWETPKDWERIVPGIFDGVGAVSSAEVETGNFTIAMHLKNVEGRITVKIQHAQIGDDKREALDLRFTARGPIDSNHSLEDGLDGGRAAIVKSFTEITSRHAHEHWRRTR